MKLMSPFYKLENFVHKYIGNLDMQLSVHTLMFCEHIKNHVSFNTVHFSKHTSYLQTRYISLDIYVACP